MARHVLVVEDEAHLAAGLKLNLELDGYRAVIARSVREATAQLVEAAPIDLILLDVMLPDGDGYNFCKQLRDAGQYMPVIMLTARSAAEERVRALIPVPMTTCPNLSCCRSCSPGCVRRCAAVAGSRMTLHSRRFAERLISARRTSTSIPTKPPPPANRCG
jgi:CheY-like chemotaxis protein